MSCIYKHIMLYCYKQMMLCVYKLIAPWPASTGHRSPSQAPAGRRRNPAHRTDGTRHRPLSFATWVGKPSKDFWGFVREFVLRQSEAKSFVSARQASSTYPFSMDALVNNAVKCIHGGRPLAVIELVYKF